MFKDYNTTQTFLPLDLEIMIDPADISVVIHEFVESLPEKIFDLFEKETGRPAYHPKMMVKITLCAYAQGIRSGRKIEDLVKDSIRMRWLARENEPSYRTINRFRTEEPTAKLLESCFIQFFWCVPAKSTRTRSLLTGQRSKRMQISTLLFGKKRSRGMK